MVERLRGEAEALRDRMVAVRRDLHAHPELGFKEVRTAGIAAKRLGELGYEVQTGVGRTGVVGVLEGERPAQDSRVLLMRFDMDALPILEANDLPYRSTNDGVMHACGHDAHTSVGLAVAELLATHRTEWSGVVKIIFQPAEETVEGALAMIKDGVLSAPKPDHVLSMHVDSMRPCGTVGVTDGAVLAATDDFYITVRGRGSHGSSPHQGADPVVASAQIITALQSIVTRNVNPLDPAVVSVGYIRGGTATNVIPDVVEFGGTMRSYKTEVGHLLRERIKAVAEAVAEALGVHASVAFAERATPPTVNDPATAALVRDIARDLVSPANVYADYRLMWAEDAAYYLKEAPGAFIFVGAGNAPRGIAEPHHSPRFQIDEDALPIAAALLSASAITILNQSEI
ncbi:MAG: amidohydrolase [Chloroflexi bacterium]|nr:amidohydrolase [Chloroflexota bacterium]MCL5273456.1 amidohydrolase [Chloroflexota bacterium]